MEAGREEVGSWKGVKGSWMGRRAKQYMRRGDLERQASDGSTGGEGGDHPVWQSQTGLRRGEKYWIFW